ncbi:UNVERIFIED_ORG: hypothetical protein M2154_000659 [Enterobacter sp. JUb101]|nr:hypothetical protein [Lelliottia amnigena]
MIEAVDDVPAYIIRLRKRHNCEVKLVSIPEFLGRVIASWLPLESLLIGVPHYGHFYILA